MAEHVEQVRRLYEAGRGLSIMKIIGQRKAPVEAWDEWIRWGFDFPYAHSVNLGITFPTELELDVRLEAERAARHSRKAA